MGQTTGKIKLAELTGHYVGKKWTDYSCIKLVHDFYKEIGVDVPDHYDGIELEKAIDVWRTTPWTAITKMIALFKKLGDRSSTRMPQRFDLLVLRRGSEVYPGIYLGGNKYMTSTLTEGVIVSTIGSYCRPIMARRLI